MMDKQKKESPPGTQSSGKTPGFKIPKKKPDDWCEDIPASSPLTKLHDSDFRNVSFRRVRQSAYSIQNFKIPKKKPDDWCEDIPASSPLTKLHDSDFRNVSFRRRGRDSVYETNNLSRNMDSHLYYTLRLDRAPHTSEYREQHREREIGTKNEVQRREERKEDNFLKYYVYSFKLQKNASKSIVVTPPRCERTYCYKRAEHQNKKTSLSPSSADFSSSSSEPFTDRTLSCTLDSPGRKNISRDKINRTAEEKKKSSDDGCSSDPPKPSSLSDVYSKTRKKPLAATNDSMKIQPIVLSSDDDEAAQKETKSGFPHTVKKTSVEKKCPSPSKDAEPMDHSGILKDAPTELEQSDSSVLRLKFLNVYYGKKRGRVSELAKFTATSIEIPLKVALHKITSLSVETRKLHKYGFWITKGGDSVRSSAVIILWLTPDYVPVIERQMELSARKQSSKSNEFIFLELVEPLKSKEQSLMNEIMVEASKHGSPSLAEVLSWEEICTMLESLPSDECSFKLNCCSAGSQLPEEWECPSKCFALPKRFSVHNLFGEGLLKKCTSSPVVDPPVSRLNKATGIQGEESLFRDLTQRRLRPKKVKSTYSLTQKWSDGGYSFSMVPEQHNILGEAQRSGPPIRLLVYPPPPTKGGLGVSNEDLQCLEQGEFLNDVIIDFYLKYLMLEIFPKPFADRCHIFSSFFFRCLTRKENGSNDTNLDISTAERRHRRVKNWTRHIDIFTKDFIFVPVNENCHWYLAVICFPWLEKAMYEDKKETDVVPSKTKDSSNNGSVIVFNDRLSKTEETTEDGNSGSEGSCSSGPSYNQKYPKPKESHSGKVCKRPCILIFDSLTTGSVRTTVQVLREYLKVECHVKRQSEREFSRSSMRELYPKVPKQNNSTDCGLYLLQYVESFSQKPIENFEPPMHLENWFPSCVVKNKREEIRDLILRLHVEQKKKG
ncbi:PREDICTED: sentrin-specific protease 7 [Nanorana parkeri]|uniref:sentrin-specific protease 7 n=1 Tax=Nanorana parkeri TaxID=125878 RepID=UPI000854AAB6|nr:PREDICTED: sentrin-specific protease 7 [Nanorana parkeri]